MFDSKNTDNNPQTKVLNTLKHIQDEQVECTVLLEISIELYISLKKLVPEPFSVYPES